MSAEAGSCIICGEKTAHRSKVAGRIGVRPYSHWRCPPEEFDQCADRRDMRRQRPRHRDAGLDCALAVAATTSGDHQ